MRARYVLVADASRARLFHQRPKHDLELVESFEHVDSRARSRDLMADANGRKAVGPSVGANYGGRSVSLGVGRPGVAPDTEPRQVEAEKFARALASALEGRLHNSREAVVLVAPAHFLGLLRDSLSVSVFKRIELTVAKDLTKLDARELGARMLHELPPA